MSILNNIHAALESVPADKREQNATNGWIQHEFGHLDKTQRRCLSITDTIVSPLIIYSKDVDLSIFRKTANREKVKK